MNFDAPANRSDSRFYFPTMDRFGIKPSNGKTITQPGAVIGDASFDAKEIRICNQMN
jgi:hypothetical protein